MMYKIFLVTVTFAMTTTTAFADTNIPMTDKAYNGKYFLISNNKNGKINLVVYKSVFKSATIYSKMEINCSTSKYRQLGEGINSIRDIKTFSYKGPWVRTVYGASHYDIVRFVCK